MKDFVQIQGYDALVKQAIAHDEKARQPDHVIEVGHVQHLINHMCNIAEKVLVRQHMFRLGFALTAFKLQGRTLPKLIISVTLRKLPPWM